MVLVVAAILIAGCSGKIVDAKSTIADGQKVSKPNIIFVLLDDVSAKEFSIYGGRGINTPTFDKMAKEGVAFNTAYASPICGPTRANLITAKYAHGNKHYSHSNTPKTTLSEAHYTMGEAMSDAGYRTAWFGKQHHDRSLNPSDFGFDNYVICKQWLGHDGPSQGRTGPDGMYGGTWYWHPAILANGAGVPTTPNDFGPGIELDSLISFVSKPADEPFFAYWPTNLPHHEYDPQADKWYRPDVPAFDRDGEPTGERIPGSLKSNIEYMDMAMEKIIATLEETNQLDNTVIFMIGDNGTAGYGKGQMQNEVALRVPFIAYGPQHVVKREMSDVLVDMTDMLPTFLELADYSTPETRSMHGKSFASYLQGETFESRDWIASQLDEARWLRTQEWLLDGNGDLWFCGDESDEQMFQKVNVQSSEEYKLKKQEMQALLDQNIPKLN